MDVFTHSSGSILLSLCIGSKDRYGVSSYGISVTTMEEVFMKVGEGRESLQAVRWVRWVGDTHTHTYYH